MFLPVIVVGGNLAFLVGLGLSYIFVVRRRAKLYLLIEHVASLAGRGLPFHAGLRALGQDLRGSFGARVTRLGRRLEEGQTLGEAVRADPRTFPPLFRSMVAVGEASGNPAAFLEEMRRSYRRAAELPSQTVYFFLYPVLLSICINVGLTGLYVGIFPKLSEIMSQTRLVIEGYDRWWARLLTANEIVLGLCLAMVFFILMGGPSGHFGRSALRFVKRVTDRVVLALPLIRGLVRDGAIHHFALCAGLFLRAGSRLPEAARAAAEVEPNGILRRRWERVADRLGQGARLSEAMREEGGFPSDLAWFVETGEAAGTLPDHLVQAAVHYETKSRFAAQVASRAVIPFFVILNGALVLATFVLIFLPILKSREVMIPG